MRKIHYLLFYFLFFAFVFFFPNIGFSQQGCDDFTEIPYPKCNCDDCEELFTSWNPITANACEGEPFQLTGVESEPQALIEDYHWYFIDASIVDGPYINTAPEITYTYQRDPNNLPDCDDETISIEVTLIITSLPCPEGESCKRETEDLTVYLKPVPFFTYEQQVCVNDDITFDNESCHASTFHWDFGDGTTSNSSSNSVDHNYDSTGVYTVTLTASNDNCNNSATYTQQIQVVGYPDAVFNYDIDPASGCEPLLVTFDDQSNQWSSTSWQIIPNDTLLWCFTDTNMTLNTDDIQVLFKESGEYEIILTSTNVCETVTETEIITVFETPWLQINSAIADCDNITVSSDDLNFIFGGEITQICWTFDGNATGPPMLCEDEFSNITFNNSGTITLTAKSPCWNGDSTVIIDVSIIGSAPVDISSNAGMYCPNDGIITLQSNQPGGIWSSNDLPPGSLSTNGELDLTGVDTGFYSIKQEIGTGTPCPSEDEVEIEVLPLLSVDLPDPDPDCETLTFTPTANFTGDIDNYLWIFPGGNPATSTNANPGTVVFSQPDTFYITIQINGRCGTVIDSALVQIQANVAVAIDPVPAPLCSGSSPDTLTANPSGGTWSGDGIIDPINGVFDPGSVAPNGTYPVTYIVGSGVCSASDVINIEVVQSTIVTVQNEHLCIDGAPIFLTVSEPGGTFVGTGIVDAATGEFDPSAPGVIPGINPVTYSLTDQNNCNVSTEALIQVDALPIVQLSDTTLLCLSDIDVLLQDVLNYSVDSIGGNLTWSGNGVIDAQAGIFNPVQAGLAIGLHTIYIDYERIECTVRDSAVIELIPNTPLLISGDSTVCIQDSTLQLVSNLSGGDWLGPGVNISTGLIILSGAGEGTHNYTYVFEEGTSCEQKEVVQITVEDPSSGLDAGPNVEFCDGPAIYLLTGASPTGGFWTGTAVDSFGNIDLTLLELDSLYTYNYCFESSGLQDCEACASRTLIIHSNPVADFNIVGSPCVNEQFQAVNTSNSIDPTDVFSYQWDFGDGSAISVLESPFYTYTSPGNYTISLTVTTSDNCATTFEKMVYITTPATPDFTLQEDEGCAPFPVQIQNNSFGDSIIQYIWYIAGDTIIGDTPGNYIIDSILTDSVFSIVLEVQNICGSQFLEQTVLVHPYPLVEFGINQDEECSPVVVDFHNATLGNPDTFLWILSTGLIFTGKDLPIQTFTAEDSIEIYTITLIAENECGIDSLTKTVTVYPPDITAFIEQDTLAGCQPFTVNLESVSTPGSILSWLIIDEDGNTQGSQVEDPIVTLDSAGWHTVILSARGVTPDCGTDFDTAYILVYPAPEISFTLPPFACVGDTVFFENTSTGIGQTDWDFGDGAISNADSPFHIFDSSGIYTITLTGYSSDEQCPASISQTIDIIENPVASFEPSAFNGCEGITINFTNFSTGEERYIWDFGDSTSQVFVENPSHTFEKTGTYSVTLIVFNQNDCSADTAVHNIFIFDLPESKFTFDTMDYCHRYDTLYLLDLSVDAVSWTWYFQGDTFNIPNPIVLPDGPGIFDIELVVKNSEGCPDTSIQQIEILESPIAQIELISPLSSCPDLQVQLQNQSQYSNNYLWQISTGETSIDFEPSWILSDPGVYTLILTSANLATKCPDDSDSIDFRVWPKPDAAFSFEKEKVCGTPMPVQFFNNSQDNWDNDWDMGDGNIFQNINQPNYTYEQAGTYNVSLIVQNEFGCLDTAEQSIDIYEQPIANFQLSQNKACEGDPIIFTNLSEYSNFNRWLINDFPERNDASFTLPFDESGTYEITLIAEYNEFCKDTFSLTLPLRIYDTPFADFSYTTGTEENIIGDVQFTNESIDADRYLWDLGDGTSSEVAEPDHEYDINRDIEVTLTAYNDNDGAWLCIDDTTQFIEPEWITTFFAPNAFTPGYGNKEIQVFRPVGFGMKTYEIWVYSPWGDLVWHSTDLENTSPSGEWDGYYDGKALPQGAYVWTAQVTFVNDNVQRFKGTVTLLR